ncbi:TMEM175 family protein [Fructobacillus cardui]|uniref:Uncharacterized membrane protein n=1 Tax=Fructobacillus cardui TaxID=2893170 RepID=A0ABM9N2F5_9LACO|nr:Uncharacterized membrane protein [Fructobacillus cardui]
MRTDRLTAYTDAVFAIALTILVLELKTPESTTWQSIWQIKSTFISYVISFLILSVFWNNHHHLFQLVKRINGQVLWANNLLIFTVSLLPWGAKFVENNLHKSVPETVYGTIYLFMSASYFNLYCVLGKADPANKKLNKAVNRPMQITFNIITMVTALVIGNIYCPPIIIITSLLLILTWIVPDRLIEKLYGV